MGLIAPLFPMKINRRIAGIIILSSVGQNRPLKVMSKPAILRGRNRHIYLGQEVLYGEHTQSGYGTCDYRVIGAGLVVSADIP
jgi:hypothetical protein